MNRKDKTIKELQTECNKRNIGFMTTWTKLALLKRLEDEDKKDNEILEVKKSIKKLEDEKNKELLKANKQLQKIQDEIKAMPSEKKLQTEVNDKLRTKSEMRLRMLKNDFDRLHEEQNKLFERTNIIAKQKAEFHKEITTLEEIIKSLI